MRDDQAGWRETPEYPIDLWHAEAKARLRRLRNRRPGRLFESLDKAIRHHAQSFGMTRESYQYGDFVRSHWIGGGLIPANSGIMFRDADVVMLEDFQRSWIWTNLSKRIHRKPIEALALALSLLVVYADDRHDGESVEHTFEILAHIRPAELASQIARDRESAARVAELHALNEAQRRSLEVRKKGAAKGGAKRAATFGPLRNAICGSFARLKELGLSDSEAMTRLQGQYGDRCSRTAYYDWTRHMRSRKT